MSDIEDIDFTDLEINPPEKIRAEEVDFTDLDELPRRSTGHGGARRGAGRKPKAYQRPVEVQDYDKARASNESAKALRNQLAFEIESGNYVARDSVRQASATAMAELTQGLRGIEDNLERQGVPVEVCIKVGAEVSRALEATGKKLQEMAGNPEE